MVADYICYVWDEAMKDVLVSFKDGNPEDTFYDFFNAKFDKNRDFEAYLNQLIDEISTLGVEEASRMSQMKELATRPKNHNRAMCFFKVMRFYMNDGKYVEKYETTPIDSLFDFQDSRVADDIVSFIRFSA